VLHDSVVQQPKNVLILVELHIVSIDTCLELAEHCRIHISFYLSKYM